MTLMIITNISSIVAQRSLFTSENTLAASMARLTSGLRANSAKDDAAGSVMLAQANQLPKSVLSVIED
jgi:flagellin